jgi:hypothetical protein
VEQRISVNRLGHARLGRARAGEPLWKVVPTRDEQGRLLADFMMLIPGLRESPPHRLEETLARLHLALLHCREVVFADVNLRLNLLWVSVRTRPGVVPEVAGRVQALVPEACLVAEKRFF